MPWTPTCVCLRLACASRGVGLRVHFKSLKCGSLARYLAGNGVASFLCAKLNEAEVLADAGIGDILVANQVIGPIKLRAWPGSRAACCSGFAWTTRIM